jgi:nitrite reductase/ring-hydroxylating ferredoxin subunit
VFREAETVNVLSDVCSHLAGPLHEGKLKGGNRTDSSAGAGASAGSGEPCVVCPWHGSTFSLRSGEVQAGPATSRQPLFETRVTGGLVEVNLPGAD